MSTLVATEVPELAVVEFTRPLAGHPQGAVGVVISAHPEEDWYTVEITNGYGRALALVPARSGDLRVTSLRSPSR